jgi:Holliday junction resolvase
VSTASSGRAREHKVRHDLERHGFTVIRSAGSKGAADLVAAHPDSGVILVQVGAASKALGPDDRERLCDWADVFCALPILARVVPRQGIEYMLVARTLTAWERWTP